jgi:hypothetical protein
MITEAKRRHGSPTYCFFYLTKNNHRRNLGTIDILHAAGISCCVGLAVQDFDEGVLEAVRRDNIQSGESVILRDICGERGIPTHNELILGLPRQTFASFSRTVVAAMPPYPGHTFGAFQCRLIDNTELASPESRARYGIETRRCRWIPTDTEWDAVVDEYQDVVVATADLPVPEWRRTFRFAYLASALYNHRVLRVVLQYLGTIRADRVAWLAGLGEASATAARGSVLAEIGEAFDRYLDAILASEPFVLPVAALGGSRMPIEGAVAAIALARPDAFFDEVQAFTEALLGGGDAALAGAFAFQSLITPRLGTADPEPVDFEHDWAAYAVSGSFDAPVAGPVRVRFVPPAYARQDDPALLIRSHLATVSAGMSAGAVETSTSEALAQAG